MLRPRREGDREVPPSSAPEPTPRTPGFWPLLALVIAGTFALAAWALWPSASSDVDSTGSGYVGDWKDTVVTERAADGGADNGADPGYVGDWKDTVVTERAADAGADNGADPGYRGDPTGTVTAERIGSGPR